MNCSDTMKEKWADPEYKKKQKAAMKEAWTEKRRQKLRKRMLGNIVSPETMQKISTSNIRTWQKNHGI